MQNRDRLAAGEDWIDSGLTFTAEDGGPLREQYVSKHFAALIKAADLPRSGF